jgi:hypothetical protein
MPDCFFGGIGVGWCQSYGIKKGEVMTEKRKRGPSAAMIEAEKYFAKNPGASFRQIAEKFHIHPVTVQRAKWWRERASKQA